MKNDNSTCYAGTVSVTINTDLYLIAEIILEIIQVYRVNSTM